jgi:hypothetical protein
MGRPTSVDGYPKIPQPKGWTPTYPVTGQRYTKPTGSIRLAFT